MNEAVIALCKCGESHKAYGVRFERIDSNTWQYTWAFPINEKAAKREGYDSTKINGNILPSEDYPGCPYCGSKYFMVCSCGKLNCNIVSPDETATCNWCGSTGYVSNYEGDGFTAGGDF
ncbi:MAG: hypothetical protein EOM34_15990 [Clostridia bacterium]|nr:hypothetical protein [Clostridia bacterium]